MTPAGYRRIAEDVLNCTRGLAEVAFTDPLAADAERHLWEAVRRLRQLGGQAVPPAGRPGNAVEVGP